MAWTDLEFDFGSILTSSNMTNLQANFQAMADGDEESPPIFSRFNGGYKGSYTTTAASVQDVYLYYYYNIPNTENVHFRYEMLTGNASNALEIIVTANGISDSQTTTSTSYVTKTGSISLSGQDLGWQSILVQFDAAYVDSYLKDFFYYIQ